MKRDRKKCERLLRQSQYYADHQADAYHGEALNAIIKVLKKLLKTIRT